MSNLNMRTAGIVMMFSVFFALSARANNIKVDNVRTRGLDAGAKEVYIEFDLSWENAWRNAVNHDAAWVFAKFRAPGSNEWRHAYLVADAGAHWAPNAVIAVGTNDAAGMGSGLGMGVFVYANADQAQGPADYSGTRLRWDFGASGYTFTAGDAVDVSVHAIEMVYVAEGTFYVGSGGTESGSFTDGSWISGATIPFRIAGEDTLEIGPDAGKLYGTSTGGLNQIGAVGTLAAAFPKGYGPFYCMKYSITQGQYADFLNLLNASQQSARAYTGGTDRHTISKNGDIYAAATPDRACNYLSWADLAAYLDWSGLRPMTELEYEKACRGPEYPVPSEYAWGTTTETAIGNLEGVDGSGEEYYTEGNLIWSGSHPGGPVRVGIFARPGSTREEAGASYWGIMELSGNVTERAIISVGRDKGREFTGRHGNGVLHATTGDSTGVTGWPGTGGDGAGFRGGSLRYSTDNARVSSREYAALAAAVRFWERGGRAVRAAPPQ